jgi:RNA polymerase sigma factor (sigma-70 family)
MSSPAANSGPELERMFLSALTMIDRIIVSQTRRHALTPADADEYAAWAKARIIDSDYAVLRKFGGRSSLSTYLTAVLVNLFRDFRNTCWGRWRPSAAAKRFGPIAIRLEELLYREAHSLREAGQILQSAGAQLSDADIARLASRIPSRPVVRELSLQETDSVVATIADSSSHQSETDPELESLEITLRSLLNDLKPEDALIVRMRFWSGMSVADIARALQLKQKPLYRRIEAIQVRMRSALEARGIDRATASDFLSAN